MHPNLFASSLTQISCLWPSPPGISVHPHTRVLIYLHNNKTQVGITNEDDGHNTLTNKYNEIRWVNVQQIDNLKILHIVKGCRLKGTCFAQTTAAVHHPTTFMHVCTSCCRSWWRPAWPTQRHHLASSHDDPGGTYPIRAIQHEVQYIITTSTYLGYYKTVVILEIVKLHMKINNALQVINKEVGKPPLTK